MRYSVLAHLSKMARTLQEAALYIDMAPDGDPVCPELLSNGVKMLEQIRGTVEQHREDLHDPVLLEHLSAAEALWKEGGDALQGALEAFAQALPDSIRYQVRAVFFTGLGSTWDAMQSVYEYMRDDPRFDPVVVLIPVFRQVQQDGQVKQEITYTDYLTPMGIPFMEHNQYSLERDCPDLAFTNQPYESVVPEEFWPGNIAQYTRLVYLPYYLADKVAAATVVSQAQLPVHRFAWKVVSSNEKHYRFYCRHAANKGANGLLTGIPKTDFFVGLAKKGVSIPNDWACLRGKTIFLWNSWYEWTASSLRYFEQLMEWFAAHKDCALLWRPHPMTDTVTKLYYPEHYPAYREMLKQAQNAENIMLDTETSCAAAFCASDAMFSDFSSLLPQYLLLDKPALWIQGSDFHFTGEDLIDSRWMEKADSIDGILAFIEHIRKGEDHNAELRHTIRQRDLCLADGHCGERVCEALWEALHGEDFPKAWAEGSPV